MNKPGEDIFLLALKALGAYAWSRPEAAPSYISALDEIEAKSAQIDAILYDDLLAHERDYRQEMTRSFFLRTRLSNFAPPLTTIATVFLLGLRCAIPLRTMARDSNCRNLPHRRKELSLPPGTNS